ncbi:CRE-MPZ-1 protein, partial [Aphelenchoides avenae]
MATRAALTPIALEEQIHARISAAIMESRRESTAQQSTAATTPSDHEPTGATMSEENQANGGPRRSSQEGRLPNGPIAEVKSPGTPVDAAPQTPSNEAPQTPSSEAQQRTSDAAQQPSTSEEQHPALSERQASTKSTEEKNQSIATPKTSRASKTSTGKGGSPISLKDLQEMALTTFCRENWVEGKCDTVEVELERDPQMGLGITVAGYVHKK